MVDLGLAAKVRPCLVVSVAFADSERALFSVVPHTTSVWSTRFEVPTAVRWLSDGAFDVQGIRPVPEKTFIRRLGVAPQNVMTAVETAICAWFGV